MSPIRTVIQTKREVRARTWRVAHTYQGPVGSHSRVTGIAGPRYVNKLISPGCTGAHPVSNGVFPCISEDAMLPFVLFYSVKNPS
jgi:hypothetical protein